jgi:uncharacterized small protein (DUF1192 family)
MKVVTWWVWISLWACVAHAAREDRTIGKVVKLLQEMLEKSKQEADEERVLFAKYKCYCDDNEREKKESIEELTNNIEFLSTKIEELKGENGELSKDVAKLSADMTENEATRAGAESLREKSHEVFLSEESDMENAISGFNDAVKVLKELTGASLNPLIAFSMSDSSLKNTSCDFSRKDSAPARVASFSVISAESLATSLLSSPFSPLSSSILVDKNSILFVSSSMDSFFSRSLSSQ